MAMSTTIHCGVCDTTVTYPLDTFHAIAQAYDDDWTDGPPLAGRHTIFMVCPECRELWEQAREEEREAANPPQNGDGERWYS